VSVSRTLSEALEGHHAHAGRVTCLPGRHCEVGWSARGHSPSSLVATTSSTETFAKRTSLGGKTREPARLTMPGYRLRRRIWFLALRSTSGDTVDCWSAHSHSQNCKFSRVSTSLVGRSVSSRPMLVAMNELVLFIVWQEAVCAGAMLSLTPLEGVVRKDHIRTASETSTDFVRLTLGSSLTKVISARLTASPLEKTAKVHVCLQFPSRPVVEDF
jgi:hypothetical protein